MLAGVLGVLKIIGIVLLVILAVILVLLLLVLFVPVRYKADLNIPETEFDKGFDVDKMEFSARFSWLLHVISVGIDFPEDKQFFVKLFGIKIFPPKQKPKKDKADKDSKKEDSEEKTEEKKEESGVVEMSDMQELENNVQEEASSEENQSTQVTAEAEVATEDSEEEEPEKEDKALIEIIQDIIEKIENILKTPQNVFEKIQYTISRVCGKIKMIKTTLENDIFKRAYELVKGKLIKVIKMILPDKYKAEILIGLGDPATTAEVMAAYGIIYPITMDNVILEPDFERQVVMVKARVKGHITIFTLLYSLAVCYFNKDVKKVIRRFKKIMEA
jgi:molecular chaperone GrpE (heat shock protein)